MKYLYIVLFAAILLLVLKFVFNVSLKTIGELILNIVIGIIVLWLVNKFGGALGIPNIPINIITALVVGVFGLPGVIVLILLFYFNIV
ncbi:MAG: pro-sigmaK processing inhibitor BofA family protein [Bacilli bacterium]|nr:pro-sigmaK processing inhibitor BofA family protein [Bacilli bacterium]